MSSLSRVQNKRVQPQENQLPDVDKLDKDKIVDAYFNHIQQRTYYHGTNKKFAKDIYRYGMKIAHKQKGSTDLLKKKFGLDDKAASVHHYLMGRVSAARYAKLYRHPKIVRIVIPQEIKLEKDPELLQKKSATEGYLAIMMTKLDSWKDQINELMNHEQYQEYIKSKSNK